MTDLIPIPHNGSKPDWLEDDTRIRFRLDDAIRRHANRATDMTWGWGEYLLPTDHWAAPVLRAGLTPWNPKLQGDGPPKDCKAAGLVMLRDGRICSSTNWTWSTDTDPKPGGPQYDIIGYEREEPKP